jgi:hypothetical protein
MAGAQALSGPSWLERLHAAHAGSRRQLSADVRQRLARGANVRELWREMQDVLGEGAAERVASQGWKWHKLAVDSDQTNSRSVSCCAAAARTCKTFKVTMSAPPTLGAPMPVGSSESLPAGAPAAVAARPRASQQPAPAAAAPGAAAATAAAPVATPPSAPAPVDVAHSSCLSMAEFQDALQGDDEEEAGRSERGRPASDSILRASSASFERRVAKRRTSALLEQTLSATSTLTQDSAGSAAPIARRASSLSIGAESKIRRRGASTVTAPPITASRC